MTTNDIHELDVTPREGEHRVPVGWLLLFFGLIAWGAYYFWAFSPALTGWTQAEELAQETTRSGTNVFATVLFTLLAALTAGSILFAVALKSKQEQGR